MRYANKLPDVLLYEAFWTSLFRDFGDLLFTTYKSAISHLFSIGGVAVALFPSIIQGLFESFCQTRIDDTLRIEYKYKQMSSLFDILDDCLPSGDDPFAMQMIRFLNSGNHAHYLELMETRMQSPNTQIESRRFSFYDMALNNYARSILDQLLTLLPDFSDCIPVIDKTNEIIKLYIEHKDRDTEISYYLAAALYHSVDYFFNSGYSYDDEIAAQIAQKNTMLLEALHSNNPWSAESHYYICSLIVLYYCDDDCYYKTKDELFHNLTLLHEEYKNSGKTNQDIEKTFADFFADSTI